MKKTLIISLIGIICLTFLAGCGTQKQRVRLNGSGNVVKITESFQGFNRVQASHVFHVHISQGDDYNVVLEVDENFVDYLDVRMLGDTLDIDLRDEYNYDYRDGMLGASITMPEIHGLNLSGATETEIAGFDSPERFSAELSGASTLAGDLAAGDVSLDVSGDSSVTGNYTIGRVNLELSGSSRITLEGSGEDLTVDASGDSSLDLADFTVDDANISLSGSSDIVVNASGKIDVDASGSSSVTYLGDPEIGRIQTSGSSSVSRGG